MRDLVCVIAIFVSAAASAGSEIMTCQVIQNADSRAYCLAQATGDRWRCDAIQDADLRAQCRAGVKRN